MLGLSYTLFIRYCYCQSERRLRGTSVSGVSVLIPYYRGLCHGPPSPACLQRTNGSEPSMLLPAACPLALHTHRHTQHTAHRHNAEQDSATLARHRQNQFCLPPQSQSATRVPATETLHNTGLLKLILDSGMILIFGRQKGCIYDTQNS